MSLPINQYINGPGVGVSIAGQVYESGYLRGSTTAAQKTVVALDIRDVDAGVTSSAEGVEESRLASFLIPDATNRYAGGVAGGVMYVPSPLFLLITAPDGAASSGKFSGLRKGRANALVNGNAVNIAAGDRLCCDIAGGSGRLVKATSTNLSHPIAVALAAATTDGATIEVIFNGDGMPCNLALS